MTISVTSTLKAFVGGMIAVLLFVAFAPQTQAYSYVSYPTTPVYQTQSSQDLVAYLYALIAQLQSLQTQYYYQYGHQYGNPGQTYYRPVYNHNSYDDYDVEVETLRARDIDDEEARLYGEVDLDGAPYAYVWFEYGQGGRLTDHTDEEKVSDDDDFSAYVDDLDEDEKYYFRAVAEDPDGQRTYGELMSFETDDHGGSSSNNDDEPDVETGDAKNIDEDSARIYGEVDMNDFDDGLVFFVYGEDEDAVEDVEDENEYNDVDEEGDDLQKVKIYSNLDDERSFWLEIGGLDDDTDYYYRICVEYEDEDDDEVLVCGDTEHFQTDED